MFCIVYPSSLYSIAGNDATDQLRKLTKCHTKTTKKSEKQDI